MFENLREHATGQMPLTEFSVEGSPKALICEHYNTCKEQWPAAEYNKAHVHFLNPCIFLGKKSFILFKLYLSFTALAKFFFHEIWSCDI